MKLPTEIAVVMPLLLFGAISASETPDALQLGNEAFDRGDLITAMAHYRTAAEDGNADGQVRLAWIMDQAEENDLAVFWYRKAADQGNASGLAGLAQMYAKGEGVPKDFVKALQLFERAAELGHTGAMSVLASSYENGELGVQPDPVQAAKWKSLLDNGDSSNEED